MQTLDLFVSLIDPVTSKTEKICFIIDSNFLCILFLANVERNVQCYPRENHNKFCSYIFRYNGAGEKNNYTEASNKII